MYGSLKFQTVCLFIGNVILFYIIVSYYLSHNLYRELGFYVDM